MIRPFAKRTSARLLALVAAAVTLGPGFAWLASGRALADEYVAVTGSNQPRTDPNPYIAVAYGVVWVVVLVYVVGVARGLGRARAELAELRRRIDAASAGQP